MRIVTENIDAYENFLLKSVLVRISVSKNCFTSYNRFEYKLNTSKIVVKLCTSFEQIDYK